MKEKKILKCEYSVKGMHCPACEILIETKLSKLEGVKSVDAKLDSNSLIIDVEEDKYTKELVNEMNSLVEKNGYKILEKGDKDKFNLKEMLLSLAIASSIMLVFLLIQRLDLVNIFQTDNLNLGFIFLMGVLASLSTCMAVVGGLVLSLSSNYAKSGKTKAIVSFHISRLIGFLLLGGLIGVIGSAFKITQSISIVISLLLFLVMFLMGLNFIGLIKFQIKLPKIIGKGIVNLGKENNNESLIIPILLGLLTFILPCGFTQSMQVYALSTGSFIGGASTMFVFALGTLPILALISFASVKLAKSLRSGLFYKTSGFLIMYFAILNLIGTLTTLGVISPFN